MRRNFLLCIVTAFVLLIAGCSTVFDNENGVFGGKAQTSIHQIQNQIASTEIAQAQTNQARLEHIGAFSEGGVGYALNQDTNPSPAETVAKQMNQRIEALAAKPDFNEIKSIETIVDDLLSQQQKQEETGQKLLADKDKQIAQIQAQDQALTEQKNAQISEALQQANKDAQAADKANQTLSQMDKWFGLGAIWYGIKKFVVDAAWFLGIGGVIFLILRLASYSNPIAASIFSVFEQIGSWFINVLATLFPKALSFAGVVAKDAYNGVKGTLTTLVDCVETVKLQSSSSNQPASLETLLNTAELSMTPADKQLIENIKIELGWVRPATVSTVSPLVSITSSIASITSSTVIVTPVTTSFTVTSSITSVMPVNYPSITASYSSHKV